MTSLMGADGKVPDSKYSENNKFLGGPGGIMLLIIAGIVILWGFFTICR
jgi:hypothetical protein